MRSARPGRSIICYRSREAGGSDGRKPRPRGGRIQRPDEPQSSLKPPPPTTPARKAPSDLAGPLRSNRGRGCQIRFGDLWRRGYTACRIRVSRPDPSDQLCPGRPRDRMAEPAGKTSRDSRRGDKGEGSAAESSGPILLGWFGTVSAFPSFKQDTKCAILIYNTLWPAFGSDDHA